MTIFKSTNQEASMHADTTIVSAGTEIKGTVKSKGSLHIEGMLSGPIYCDDVITIGKTGTIQGDVQAKGLIVIGCFTGMADCDEIRILASGKVSGRIICHMLAAEKGCIFDGESRHREPKEKAGSVPKAQHLQHKVDDESIKVKAVA